MAGSDENLQVVIKTRGGPEAAAQARRLAREYENLGHTVKRMTHTHVEDTKAQRDNEKARRANERQIAAQNKALMAHQRGLVSARQHQNASVLAMTRNAAAVTSLAAAYGSLSAAMTGFEYNASIETSRIQFEHFLKSGSAAAAQMKELQRLGREMPGIGQESFMTGGRQLLAFGAKGSDLTPWLSAIGAGVNASGTGAEGMAAVVRNFGQILSTGKVMGDELNELASWGIPARRYLLESGVAKRGQDIGAQNIPAEKAINAILSRTQSEFGPLVDKSNKTWSVQTAAAKQYAREAAGAFVKPFQDFLQANVLPQIGAQLQGLTKWFKDGGAEKFWRVMGNILKVIKWTIIVLSPLIVLWMVNATWVTILAVRIVFLNFVINALRGALLILRGVILIATAAQWLWNIAMSANPIGLVIIGIAALIGIVVLLVKHWDTVKAAFVAAWAWMTEHPWAALLLGPMGAFIAIATQVVKHWDAIKAAILAVWEVVRPIIGKVGGFLKNLGEGGILGAVTGGKLDIPGVPFMAAGGTVHAGGKAVVGEAGPELLENDGTKTTVTPMSGAMAGAASRVLQPLYLMVDGRVFAETMVDVGQTAAVRR